MGGLVGLLASESLSSCLPSRFYAVGVLNEDRTRFVVGYSGGGRVGFSPTSLASTRSHQLTLDCERTGGRL